jgi:hypothetical protein
MARIPEVRHAALGLPGLVEFLDPLGEDREVGRVDSDGADTHAAIPVD